jgi:hypothetical protein
MIILEDFTTETFKIFFHSPFEIYVCYSIGNAPELDVRILPLCTMKETANEDAKLVSAFPPSADRSGRA